MNARLLWEAAVCESCGSSVIHKLRDEPKLAVGDACPRCEGPLRVIYNPSVIANIVYATLGNGAD